jgi:hypothetical protein
MWWDILPGMQQQYPVISLTWYSNVIEWRQQVGVQCVYKKLGEIVKYLNIESHHCCHHKSAILSRVELHLALLTTMIDADANMGLWEIYPDKHSTFSIAGQLKPGQQMSTMCKVLTYKPQSPTNLSLAMPDMNKDCPTSTNMTPFLFANMPPSATATSLPIKSLNAWETNTDSNGSNRGSSTAGTQISRRNC